MQSSVNVIKLIDHIRHFFPYSFGVSIHLSFLHSNANDSDLLEYPIYTDTFECEISSVISAHELYVQNRKYEQLIRKHIDDLYTSIQSGKYRRTDVYTKLYFADVQR